MHKSKEERRKNALELIEIRSERTNKEQLKIIEGRRGESKRETERLLSKMEVKSSHQKVSEKDKRNLKGKNKEKKDGSENK